MRPIAKVYNDGTPGGRWEWSHEEVEKMLEEISQLRNRVSVLSSVLILVSSLLLAICTTSWLGN